MSLRSSSKKAFASQSSGPAHATQVLEAKAFDQNHYLRRTSRNHYWLGGMPGQERIRKLSIAVAGLGGMGSQVAELLVRLGVGELRIADPDTVDVSNLNRQVVARMDTVGKTKVAAAVQELRAVADDFRLVSYEQGVEPAMAAEFVEGCDAVVDEIDVFPLEAHRVLHEAARKRDLPIYSAYVVGTGIHFYKFHGSSFTFDDFLGSKPERWRQPTLEYLAELFGTPLPKYLAGPEFSKFSEHVKSCGAIPIFGPSTLLGQSLLTIRLVSDLIPALGRKGEPTPVMPEFLVLDPIDLTLRREKFPR